MTGKTLGTMIASLRKDAGMTQLELSEKMGVTDKAVSKWERDLSCPDIKSIPKLAEIFGVSVDELMQVRSANEIPSEKKDLSPMITLILKAVALAMGVSVVTLSFLQQLDAASGVGLLGLGLACLALSTFAKKTDE